MLFSLVACKSKFDDLEFSGGTANFKTYVAIGSSLTAGYADNALYISGQTNSFPSMLAAQMKKVNSSSGIIFNQPLMADENGGIISDGLIIEDQKYGLVSSTDCRGEASTGPGKIPNLPTTTLANIYASAGPFHNIGVPGSKLVDVDRSGFGNAVNLISGTANPYYVRMASDPNATMLEDAMKLSPTFFSLWIGNNDVLEHATSGGVIPPTDYGDFSTAYSSALAKLTAGGAKGIVANIPDITALPFFTLVPFDAIPLDEATANNLKIIFEKIGNYVDTVFGAGLGEQYRVPYVTGQNALIIKVDSTATNPLGWRLITKDEFVLLTIPQDSIKCAGYGIFRSGGYDPFTDPIEKALTEVNPVLSQYILTISEINEIKSLTSSFNGHIKSEAAKYNLAHVDMNTKFADIINNGLIFNDVTYTTTYVSGGTFSLDGVHITARGYAIAANHFIDGINAKYGAQLPKVNVNEYPGLYLP